MEYCQHIGHSLYAISILIVSPLMGSALEDLYQPVPYFVDTNASCDQANSELTILLVPNEAEAVSVGAAIHTAKTQA
jgi:hypothetical protein